MPPPMLGALEILLALQIGQASVVGTVTDSETGNPIPGAVVTLTEQRRATGDDGRYVFRMVPAGSQPLTVRYLGYATRRLRVFVPTDGEVVIVVALRRHPVRLPTVNVRQPRDIRGEGLMFPDRSLSIEAVRNHPLLAEPDVLRALGGGEVVLRPESPSGVHIRGGSSGHTGYVLDGIPVLSPYHTSGAFGAWNPDALQQVLVSSSAPTPVYPHALSGTVAAVTRDPGVVYGARGSVSSMQARVALDGPIGSTGAGILLSMRRVFPDLIAPSGDAAYLRGELGDWLAKVEAPALGGNVRLLGFGAEDEVNTAVAADLTDVPGARRNAFEWNSRSLGAEWRREVSTGAFRIVGWSATAGAGVEWNASGTVLDVSAARQDLGLLAVLERRTAGATTIMGARAELSETSYGIVGVAAADQSWEVRATTPVATAFVQHARRIGDRTELEFGTALAQSSPGLYVEPRARLRWNLSPTMTFTGSFARTHQFAQSLRNEESVVSNIFPADMHIGAAADGVPVARSDLAVIALDVHPLDGVRLGVQAYRRALDDLLLVAPRSGQPFTTGSWAVGSGLSRGASVDAALSAARYLFTASYGVQTVRFRADESAYIPEHGTAHTVQGGVSVFPTPSTTIRLGAIAAYGRRTTAVSGGLEWESCNLSDQGCEFAGSPHYQDQMLGATRLPAYVRVDVGFRKEWSFAVEGRGAAVALFGTVTNVLGRGNVLTYATDPATGLPVAVDMRPRAPLVVGLDWRF